MFIRGISLAGNNQAIICVISVLAILALLLAAGLYRIRNYTVRIYNWNGKRFCYLGRAGLRREQGGYCVHIGERLADLSYTTLYQICPSGSFVRRNRYRNMLLCAGEEQCMLHIDRCMRKSLYYRKTGQRYGTLRFPIQNF